MESICAVHLGDNRYSVCTVGMWALLYTWEDKDWRTNLLKKWNEDDDVCPKRLMTSEELAKISGCYKVIIKGNRVLIGGANSKKRRLKYPALNGMFDYKEFHAYPLAPKLN